MQQLKLISLDSSAMWFDAGTPDSLLDAGNYVIRREAQGSFWGYPEISAWKAHFINWGACTELADALADSPYGRHLKSLLSGSISGC